MELKDIENLAKLCRIELADNEKENLLGEMDAILDFVEQIREVKTETKTPSAELLKNVMREDENPRAGGFYTADILAEAPRTERGFIKVKKIL
ncbi:MAG: Asp-tRNA(Asn)/Glu-tRNA(Gln) amidotransferase subunit GatC [Patescibacteria group bacterium]